MSARVVRDSIAAGVRVFVRMIDLLDSGEDVPALNGYKIADQAQFDERYRQGLAFRNVTAEFLQQAQAIGPKAVEGFMACISDCVGYSVSSDRDYRHDQPAKLARQIERYLTGVRAPVEEEEAA
jgi:hypothetical protein